MSKFWGIIVPDVVSAIFFFSIAPAAVVIAAAVVQVAAAAVACVAVDVVIFAVVDIWWINVMTFSALSEAKVQKINIMLTKFFLLKLSSLVHNT